jgi:NAD(P)-dependent dehydrogenase (short-subunit alcohol dehydrogenase family)
MPNLLDYPVEDFRSVLDTNLIGPFLLIKNALPAMIEHGGSIINVSSDAGKVGYPGWGAYGISKFGLEGMSETWASELEDTGVRVNWVDPGNMNTAMHRAAAPEEDPTEWVDPASVTDVFLFLASDESKNVQGKRFEAQEDWRAVLSSTASAPS